MGNTFSNIRTSSSSAPSATYTLTPASNSSSPAPASYFASPSPANYYASPAQTSNSAPASNSDSAQSSSAKGTCAAGTMSSSSSSSTTTTTTASSPAASPTASVPFTGSSDAKSKQILNEIFNSTTFSIMFWVFVSYIVYKLGSAIFATRDPSLATSAQIGYSRTIDIILGVGLILYMVYWYSSLKASDQDNILGYFISWTQEWLDDPWSLFELVWFTIIFFILVYILRVPMAPGTSPALVNLVEHKIWIFYATFAIVFFFKYVLGIPIISLLFNNTFMNYLKNAQPSTSSVYNSILAKTGSPMAASSPSMSSSTTTTTTTNTNNIVSSPASCNDTNQVFNVSNNLYTYEEAQEVCKAFDSTLATYDQIENSYQNGGEWCNYGWSDGQMAYFPTQKATWSKLQQNPKSKNACGRPGINGGYIANPYVRFGANCYGAKPKQPANWVAPKYEQPYDLINVDLSEDKNSKLRDSVNLNSFNLNNWSRY